MSTPTGTISAVEIVAAVRSGASSVVEEVQAALARRDAYDATQASAWISRTADDVALAEAANLDARLAKGDALPLAGLTFAVKDNLDARGHMTTAGCPDFAYSPAESAFVVKRLEEAGAICLGKANLDQFATGLSGARSPYGAGANVFNRRFVSGGSSSGSAIVVAAGVVPFALGTDTAGSGRVPAAFNGLIGLKPTKGRYSTSGLVPACRSLDCVSVFTQTVADAAMIDAVLDAFDPTDSFARTMPAAPPTLPTRPQIGVAKADQLNFFGNAAFAALDSQARARLSALGDVVEVDITPLLDAAKLLYAGPWVAERTHALQGLLARNPNAIHPVVRAIVAGGLGVTGVDAFDGQYKLASLARAAEKALAGVDVLVLPTTPTTHTIADMLARPIELNAQFGLYTNFVNLLDKAAIAVPAGFTAENIGYGITFIGPAFSDKALLQLAASWEHHMSDTRPPLDLAPQPQPVEIQLAVVGAHLAGMPLHHQLVSRNARMIARTHTAPVYKLFAMTNTTPKKPALVHVGEGGGALEVEVYGLSEAAFGSFVAEVPAPLAIGSVELASGQIVKGFVAEPRAMNGATDITHLGGWRAYISAG